MNARIFRETKSRDRKFPDGTFQDRKILGPENSRNSIFSRNLRNIFLRKFQDFFLPEQKIPGLLTLPQSKMSACTRIVEAEQLQDDEPPKSTFFNSSLQLLRNVLICLCPDWSIQDRVEQSRIGAWFFESVKSGPSIDGG